MGDEAAAEMEVPQVVEERIEENEAEAEDGNTKKGGKKKRQFTKVTNLSDFYAPVAYTSANKGGGERKGKGKGKDGEDRGKGKGKGAYNYAEGGGPPQGPPADGMIPQGPPADGAAAAPGPVPLDGDGSQGKGGAQGKKKQGNVGGGKNREGGKPAGGGGGKGGGSGNGGKGAPGGAPRKGGSGGAGGSPAGGKGGPMLGEMPFMPEGQLPEAGPEGPRPLGPQQRPPMPGGKGVGVPMVGMPVVSQYGMPMPYPYAGQMAMAPGGPFGAMPMSYSLPYYVMPPTQMANGGMPQMYAQMPAVQQPMAQVPPLTPADRATLKVEVQQQIEYYFGMENLLKDVFLRKHMTDEGWLPIALLAGFRRIENMTSDVSILMDAIQGSTLVEVNPQNTHIRLRNEWPRWILAPQQAGTAPAAAPPQPARS